MQVVPKFNFNFTCLKLFYVMRKKVNSVSCKERFNIYKHIFLA